MIQPGTARPLRLESLAKFLRYLSNMPSPGKVASALTRGPLSVFGARALIILMAVDDRTLVQVSGYGHTPAELSRFREFSLDLDTPGVRAYREGVVTLSDAQESVASVPVYAMDHDMWVEMLGRLNVKSLVSAPIVSEGASIGVFSFLVSEELAWHDVDTAFLDVISATLGLWMTHSHNGVRESLDAPHPGLDDSLALTERQVTVLHLIDHGRSNEAIANSLGYSQSTIKADMQAIHRTLRTRERTSAVARAYELGILPLKSSDRRPASAEA